MLVFSIKENTQSKKLQSKKHIYFRVLQLLIKNYTEFELLDIAQN